MLSEMQKRCPSAGLAPLAFDTSIPPRLFYLYVFSIRRQGSVLLLPDAGVWVGISEILPNPPGKAGGFFFHPLSQAGSRVGRLSES